MTESYPAYAVLCKRPDGGEYLLRDSKGAVRHWFDREAAVQVACMWADRRGRVVPVTVTVKVEE